MGATQAITFVKSSVGWSIALSILMIVAGILAIASPMAAGIAVNVLVAWLLLFSGCFHLVFAWHTRTAGGLIWELLIGIAYIFTGVYILMHPLAGLASLTIVLAIYLTAKAIFELLLGFTIRPLPGSGWLLLDGVVTLILAVMIWRTWPSSTEWVIGTLVGVSMLFSGTSRLALSLAARRLVNKLA
ncbi:MAG TPA: HdeD family acid-resistance protein [Candidatus Acidoferrum sp.]|nr:HdeD family acid-resistance protein [Candidatus Acidoferrum sp.]